MKTLCLMGAGEARLLETAMFNESTGAAFGRRMDAVMGKSNVETHTRRGIAF